MTDKSDNENADECSGKKPEADTKASQKHKGGRNDGACATPRVRVSMPARPVPTLRFGSPRTRLVNKKPKTGVGLTRPANEVDDRTHQSDGQNPCLLYTSDAADE